MYIYIYIYTYIYIYMYMYYKHIHCRPLSGNTGHARTAGHRTSGMAFASW